jgi:hypothetical protein
MFSGLAPEDFDPAGLNEMRNTRAFESSVNDSGNSNRVPDTKS